MDIGLLSVEGAVFHHVPGKARRAAGAAAEPEPRLSAGESVLEDRLRAFLCDRIKRTFTESGHPIERDPDQSPAVTGLMHEALVDPSHEIVERFRPLPALLLEVQAPIAPQGLFAVVRGRCGTQRVVILMKVEQEQGLSFEIKPDDSPVCQADVRQLG